MSDDDAVDRDIESSADAETDASAGSHNGSAETVSEDRTTVNGQNATEQPNKNGDEARTTASADLSVPDALAEDVAEYDEDLGEAVAELEDELLDTHDALIDAEAEVDELTSKLARVRADFSNYKQRAKRKQQEIRERASESLVERIVPVRNDLLRALDQDEGSDLRPGVESTVEKFDEVLAEEGVEPITPEPGDEVDPARHQVMLRVESDAPEGTVSEVYEPGYEMGDRVITEAQVTVSKGTE